MSKICSTCHIEKPEENFYWKIKQVKRQSYCSSCQNIKSKQNYIDNKQQYLKRVAKNNLRYRTETRQKLWDYLTEHPCIQCKCSDPILLDFDHLGDKSYNISSMVSTIKSWEKIKKEIAKCQILCIVCHRYKTAKEQGWYKNINQNMGR